MIARSYWYAFAGFVGGISIACSWAWPLSFVCIIPLIAALYDRSKTHKKLFLDAWIFGACFMGTVLYWFFNAYPLDWAGFPDPYLGATLVIFVWSIVSIALGAATALWSVIVRSLLRRDVSDIFVIALLWIVFEWLRMCLFMILAWGPGSVLEPYFSFGMIGYALGNNPHLLIIARYGGVYGLGLFAIFANYAIWAAFIDRGEIISRRCALSLLAAVLAFFCIISFVRSVPPTSSLRIATLSSDFASKATVSDAQQDAEIAYVQASLRHLAAGSSTPDIIVLPEDMRFISTLQSQGIDVQAYLQSLFGTKEVLIIDSGRRTTFIGTYSTVYFYSSTHGVIATHDKYILIPVGEYAPSLLAAILHVIGLGDALDIADVNRDYEPGSIEPGIAYHGATLIVLVCSEMVDPILYHQLAAGTTNPILINLSSQSDFHDSMNPYQELKTMMLVQSAWDDAPYFQSTNGGGEVRIAS